MIRKILAIDLGTKTGWASIDRNGKIKSGVQDFKTTRFESVGMRYLKFKRWLSDINIALDGVDIIYFEAVRRHLGVDASHAYGAFMGQLMVWCEHHQIPYQGVPVGTIKKFACNHGGASKQDMITSAKNNGFDVETHDEADAIHILRYAISDVARD